MSRVFLFGLFGFCAVGRQFPADIAHAFTVDKTDFAQDFYIPFRASHMADFQQIFIGVAFFQKAS